MSPQQQRDQQAMAEAEMAGNGTLTRNHIDAETVRAYNEYLRDWRWNMSTWRNLQREYMRPNHIASDNLF
jgi:hypothetical protein